jgi:hypothetical protein
VAFSQRAHAAHRAQANIYAAETAGLGSMSGPLENAEKINTVITQPLKKLPIPMWLSSTSQARYQAFLKHL